MHISFVRSVSLDEWNSKQVKNMVRWGNRRANEYWEARVPDDYYIPDENDGVNIVERWIRDKYEKKKFVAKSLPACADEEVDLTLPMSQLIGSTGGSSSNSGDKKKSKEKSSSSKSLLASAAAPAPAPKPAVAKAAAKAAPAPSPPSVDTLDLLGFDCFPSDSVAAPVAPAAAAAPSFAAFGGPQAGGADPSAQLSNAFGSFGISAAAAPAADPPPQTAATTAANIMSLYGNGQQQQQQSHMMMGMQGQQQHMGMMGGGGGGYAGQYGMQQQGVGMQMPQMQQSAYGGAGMMMQPQAQQQQMPQFGGFASAPAPVVAVAVDPFASFK